MSQRKSSAFLSDKIIYLNATQIAQLIAERELSPVEVMQAHLDRKGACPIPMPLS